MLELPRAAEVKTIRRKLNEIADQDQQTEKELTDLIETQNRVRENTNQR